MATNTQVRDFLTSRRARVTPEGAGLPAHGGNRRVPGLRREEVALLAGVSVDYDNRLERGNLAGVSESVLDAVARARFLFLDPAAREFFVDWDKAASDSVAILRSAAGRNPYDRDLTDLVGELSTRSEEFRTRWAAHDVRFHRTGRKLLRHPVVGELDLEFEAMSLISDPDLTFIAYTAVAASSGAVD